MKVKELVSAGLIASMVFAAVPARAQDSAAVVDRSAIDEALARRAQADDAERASIRALLGRDDVRAIAGEMGLDVRRAEGAVAALEGPALHRAALDAAVARDLLVGGANGTIQISLVSALLIIIIVILLAR